MITQCLVSHSFWYFSDASAKTSGSGTVARSASRRKRTSFSKEHVELLRATFETDPYPGISLRESLSQTTGLPESRIQVGHVTYKKLNLKGYKVFWRIWYIEECYFYPYNESQWGLKQRWMMLAYNIWRRKKNNDTFSLSSTEGGQNHTGLKHDSNCFKLYLHNETTPFSPCLYLLCIYKIRRYT